MEGGHETSLLLFQLVVNQNAKDFVYSARTEETHIQVARRLQSDLKNLMSVNAFLDGLFVLSTYSNMVLSHNAYYDVQRFLSRYAEHSRVGYSEWYLSILPWSHFGRYVRAAPARLFDTSDEYLAVVWTIPIRLRGQYDGAFIYCVKTSKILDTLHAGSRPIGELSAIVDADENTLVGAALGDSAERSRRRYVEDAIVSERTGWTYVSAVPLASLMAPALEFRRISWAIIGVVLLLGAAYPQELL